MTYIVCDLIMCDSRIQLYDYDIIAYDILYFNNPTKTIYKTYDIRYHRLSYDIIGAKVPDNSDCDETWR